MLLRGEVARRRMSNPERSSGQDGEEPFRYFNSMVSKAVHSDDHEVTLEPGKNHGIKVYIDGLDMFPYKEGYPLETFTLRSWDELSFTEEQVEKAWEVAEDGE